MKNINESKNSLVAQILTSASNGPQNAAGIYYSVVGSYSLLHVEFVIEQLCIAKQLEVVPGGYTVTPAGKIMATSLNTICCDLIENNTQDVVANVL